MKLSNIAFVDISKDPRNPVRGNFILELYPEPSAGEASIYDTGMLDWFEKVFGENARKDLLPGHHCTFSMTDYEPPFLAFQIVDFRDPGYMKAMAEIEDPAIREELELDAKRQDALIRDLRAPSIASAIMAILLARALKADQLDVPRAAQILEEQFAMGDVAATTLLRNASRKIEQDLTPQR